MNRIQQERQTKFYMGGPRSKKYHAYPTCDGLNATWTANGGWNTGDPYSVRIISRVDAIARGLEPCKKCKPAPLLRSAS